ncbi:MAG: Rossmann-like and DUF2520 domain-containing protein [Candidatus Sulfotelmatobacter sp.]
MTAKPRIAIVGPGNLGSTLAFSLRKAGYIVEAVLSRPRSPKKSRRLAKEIRVQAMSSPADLDADVVWFCVPDSEIARAARAFEESSWKGRVALHSSGALTSDELGLLRMREAAIASVHPLMTFVHDVRPSLRGVPFALEGDVRAVRAVRAARSIVRDLGGRSYPINKKDKAAYHAWGTFASPLLTALLATTEQVARLAGVRPQSMKKRMFPILLQTLMNYAAFDPAQAFSGPIIRGDVETIREHLRVLRKDRVAREVYIALANAALKYLPAKNRKVLKQAVNSRRS